MKTIKFTVFWTMVSFLAACSSLKISNEEKAAREAALREAINKKEFVIEVNQMIPMKGNSQALASYYSLTVNGENINSCLPYYGEAYSIPYGGGKALNFKAKITSYNLSFDGKGKANIRIETQNDEDRYLYSVEIFPNGSASIGVRSNQRQPISFAGTVNTDKNH